LYHFISFYRIFNSNKKKNEEKVKEVGEETAEADAEGTNKN